MRAYGTKHSDKKLIKVKGGPQYKILILMKCLPLP